MATATTTPAGTTPRTLARASRANQAATTLDPVQRFGAIQNALSMALFSCASLRRPCRASRQFVGCNRPRKPRTDATQSRERRPCSRRRGHQCRSIARRTEPRMRRRIRRGGRAATLTVLERKRTPPKPPHA